MSIRLVTDSTCDLPAEFIARHHIVVIPVYVSLDEQFYRDGVDITTPEFHRRLPALQRLPSTAAPSAAEFVTAYQRCSPADVVSIHLASTFSGMCHTARQMAQELSAGQARQIVVIDSEQLSMGLGWQVAAAAEAIAAGQSLPQVLAAVADARRRLKVFALLDTLEYVRRGGRVSALAAAVGEILQLKVNVELAGGQVVLVSKHRARHAAIDKLVALTQAAGPLEHLAILHAHRLEDAHALAERLAPCSAAPPIVVDVSPIVVTHVGTNALGAAAVKTA